MSNLTVNNIGISTLTVGDPGSISLVIPPKESRTVTVNEAQLLHITPGLERVRAAGWATYSVEIAGAPSVSLTPVVITPAVIIPPAPPEPVTVVPTAVEEPIPAPTVEKVAEPAPVAPAPEPEKVPAVTTPTREAAVSPDTPAVITPAPQPYSRSKSRSE